MLKQRKSSRRSSSINKFETLELLFKDRSNERMNLKAMHNLLNTLKTYSLRYGLKPEEIDKLIDLTENERISGFFRMRMIMYLRPSGAVNLQTALTAISLCCQITTHTSVKKALIMWILKEYENIENKEVVAQLYPILFVLLENQDMAPYIYQLLLKITTKDNFKMFFVAWMHSMNMHSGSEEYLLPLMKLHEFLCPDLSLKFLNVVDLSKSCVPLGIKKSELSLVEMYASNCCKLIFHEGENFNACKKILPFTEPGFNITNVLKLDERRFLFTSFPSSSLLQRLNTWAESNFISEARKTYSVSMDFLHQLSDIVEELQELPPIVVALIPRLLEIWNEKERFLLLLNLITYWPFCEFNQLHGLVLCTLYKHLASSPVDIQCAIIHSLTMLYQNWSLWECNRYKAKCCKQTENQTRQLVPKVPTLYKETVAERNDLDVSAEVYLLGMCINTFCNFVLSLDNNYSPQISHIILSFYHITVTVAEFNPEFRFIVPEPLLIYSCAFSSSACLLNSVCYLLQRYKTVIFKHNIPKSSFEDIKMIAVYTEDIKMIAVYTDDIKMIAVYTEDIKSALLNKRGFVPCKESAIQLEKICSNNSSIRIHNLEFGIGNHPALVELAKEFIRNRSDNINSYEINLVDKYRDEYQHFLSQHSIGKKIMNFLKN